MGWLRRRREAKTAADFGAPAPDSSAQAEPQQDDLNLHHCPRCGSGGITGGSDGTITCSFCSFVCKVYAQPKHPYMPQTINGQPYQIDGQPVLSDEPVPAVSGAPVQPPVPQAPGAAPGAPGPAGGLERFRVDAPAPAPPVQPVAMAVTHMGVALPMDAYVAHLAIRHADDPDGVIEQVRASRG